MPERIPSAHHTNFAYCMQVQVLLKMPISGKTQAAQFVQVYVMCLKAIHLPICVSFFQQGFKLLKKVQVTISLVTIYRCYCSRRQTFCGKVILYICLLQFQLISALFSFLLRRHNPRRTPEKEVRPNPLVLAWVLVLVQTLFGAAM